MHSDPRVTDTLGEERVKAIRKFLGSLRVIIHSNTGISDTPGRERVKDYTQCPGLPACNNRGMRKDRDLMLNYACLL